MQRFDEHMEVPVTKDSENEGPIPSAWRPVIKNIVEAFVRYDYRLAEGVVGAAPVPEKTAAQICTYIQQYGVRLASLPRESWATSVCMWMGGHWDALIDLWTEEEGSSDLVLMMKISEVGDETVMTVCAVHVP